MLKFGYAPINWTLRIVILLTQFFIGWHKSLNWLLIFCFISGYVMIMSRYIMAIWMNYI